MFRLKRKDNRVVFTPGLASGGVVADGSGVVMLRIMPGPKGQILGKNIILKEEK